MNPWQTIVDSVPASVLSMLGDLTPVLGLIIGLGVLGAVVAIIAGALRG